MRKGFTVHWNGPAARCVGRAHDRCIQFWDAVKVYHTKTRGWSDIAYSFGVCPHGVRFVGRGWTKPQFANGADVVGPNDGPDRDWYTVLAFIGEGEQPTREMVEGIKKLIIEGRNTGVCSNRVLPHLDFKVKSCPGPELTALCRVWDRSLITLNDTPMKEWDEMATKAEIAEVVRKEISNYFGKIVSQGQLTFEETVEKILPTVYGNRNRLDSITAKLNSIAAAIGALSVDGVDEAKLAEAIVADLSPSLREALKNAIGAIDVKVEVKDA